MELLFLVKQLEIQSYNESDSNANIVTKALREEDFPQFNWAFGWFKLRPADGTEVLKRT